MVLPVRGRLGFNVSIITPHVEFSYVRYVNRHDQSQAAGAQPLDQPAVRGGRAVIAARARPQQDQPSDQREQVAQDHGQAVADHAGQLTEDQAADRHSQDEESVPPPTGLIRIVTAAARRRQPDGHRVPDGRRADHDAAQTHCRTHGVIKISSSYCR